MTFKPKFSLKPSTVKSLMAIEVAKESIQGLPITAAMLSSLRESARLLATHYSTQIEGNRLTVAEVEKIIEGGGGLVGRERDETEVRNYYRALNYVEKLSRQKRKITEDTIQKIHGFVMNGAEKASDYRDGQNVIRESGSGAIIYLPPEASDVPGLMSELVEWINNEVETNNLPIPVIAGLAHYQFATIHPYYDGNGRTARLLTTLILHQYGYDLKGVYSLEEYYAVNLFAYYDALTVGKNHNYYEGNRAEADISGFLEYFLDGMAHSFEIIKERAHAVGGEKKPDQSDILRTINAQQRQALNLFKRQRVITSQELASFLKVAPRTSRDLCAKWLKSDFIEIENPSRKARSYKLAPKYEALII